MTYTSRPNALANFFGANPDAPNYLTAVFFRDGVLDRYYQSPSRYSVETGFLRCGHEWGLPIDNHHGGKVCAWLGDLGKIPNGEQFHWRAHNIPPSGGPSDTFLQNQIEARATDSKRPIFLFNKSYGNLQKSCVTHLGWHLLRPLISEDSHHLKALRIPSSNEQREFDELVLSLTKILIDSMNIQELKKIIRRKDADGAMPGISLLESVCERLGIEDYIIHVECLRKLQKLRSSGVAHRKGKDYRKIAEEYGIEECNLRAAFSTILQHATDFLDFLVSVIDSRQFKKFDDVSR